MRDIAPAVCTPCPQIARRGVRSLSSASISATAKAGKGFVNGKWVAAASGKTFPVTSESMVALWWGAWWSQAMG